MTRCKRTALRRLWSWVLALALLAGLVPGFPVSLPARAADSYLDPYLNKMVDWGFMRGDIEGNLNPNGSITRAEFVTIINRAFGYDQGGSTPFNDVPSTAWYAEDVGIAYNEGYITGTSENTFSPLSTITREEAAVILTRNLMMQADTGEDVSFTDSRDFGEWSRGYIATAARYQLLNGYPDGSFRPQNQLSRGEAAILIVNAIGTPIQNEESQSLGYVYGNVTITASGATLRDTVVAGNLYITAGVDLGHVTLENVTVLGEIVISGGGVSEGGEDSVVLRNVTTPTLIVDNLKNQQVSIRVSGDGTVQNTSVRTETYIEDTAPSGCGLLRIALEGETEIGLKLAGNIKEVVNYTPGSALSLERGTAEKITVDEKATSSTLEIVSGAVADEVNLDVGTTVSGSGDINKLVVNANGSTVSMLPDQIVIRPGNTANIAGEQMDTNAAAESSADPRMLAGYPRIADLAPTSATAQFAANKKGTLYWAITAVTDGSVGVEDLINPSSYSPKVVKSGSVSLTGSGQMGSAKISGLTSDGSYYLSAVFVDARDERSPLKVISFTTPDDTKPDFASGYPYLSKITNISGQVTAMATKTCRLYWAVLPKGASAPTGDDFKSNAVTGNLGYGTMDVTKNTEYTFEANNVPLEELASYDLYLWLTDVDGAQSSAVKKLSFTTVDRTPPVFNTEPTINKVDKTSVGLYANLNEAGTLYWVVVAQGEEYPKPLAGQSGAVDLSSETAKLQVMAGMNALKSGKVSMTEGKDVSFTVSGLDPEKAYDLYYVAQDKAGNYSATVGKITIHTLDPNAPTVTQEFTKYNGTDTTTPLPNTDIRLVFSEAVQDDESNTALVKLYEDIKAATSETERASLREKMATILRKDIVLYMDTGNGRPEPVTEALSDADKSGDWTIDYRYAEIKLEEGKTVVIFPTKEGSTQSALNLKSGATYYFVIQGIADTSSAKNVMGVTTLPQFRTVFAQVNLSVGSNTETVIKEAVDSEGNPVGGGVLPADGAPIDLYWRMDPISTQKVEQSICWDMILWSDTYVEFQLFRRISGENDGKWELVGNTSIMASETIPRAGGSLRMDLEDPNNNNPTFDQLNTLKEGTVYEYAVSFTKVEGEAGRDTWSRTITFDINAVAGSNLDLPRLGANVTESNWDSLVGSALTNIGQPSTLTLHKPFRDQTAPHFIGDRPTFTAGDSTVRMDLMLDRTGTIYWAVAKRGDISTLGPGGEDYSPSGDDLKRYEDLPTSGLDDNIDNDGNGTFKTPVTTPPYNWIVDAGRYLVSEDVQYDSLTCGASVKTVTVNDLTPNQDYVAYFVIQGTSQVYSEVYCYRFSTGDVTKPAITLEELSPQVSFTTSEDSNLNYVLFAGNQLPDIFEEYFYNTTTDPTNHINDSTKEDEYTRAAGAQSETMTVLDTMLKTGSGGYSWFDLYADETTKEQVRLIIERGTGSGGNPATAGSIQGMTANIEQLRDFTSAMNDESATYYYCVATAKNVLGGQYAFKAVENVHIPDETPPTLEEPGGIGRPTASGYSGTLTLTFSETLYYLPDDGNTKNIAYVVNSNADAEKTDDSLAKKAMIKHMGGVYYKLAPQPESSQPGRTFTFIYNGVLPGDQLILFTDGYVCDAYGNSSKKGITLEFQGTTTGVNNAVTYKWVIVSS